MGTLTPASESTSQLSGISSHINDVGSNPHAVTAQQAGALPTGNLVLALTTGDITLSVTEFANNSFDLTGTLSGNVNIVIPDDVPQSFIVDNKTSGAFTVTVKNVLTAGVVAPQGETHMYYTNGTAVEGLTAVGGGGAVASVFGRTGAVTAATSDYTASQVANVAAGGIAATDVQAAINELDTEKAPLASPAFTGTPTGITAAHVGLGSVDNTADTAKPVSAAQQTALNLKQDVATALTIDDVYAAVVALGE